MKGVIAQAARKLGREWRSGELAVLLMALIVAVAALTAVGFFTERVGAAVAQQATEVLAADLVLSSGRALAPELEAKAAAAGLRSAAKLSFPSVVLSASSSSLADIEAVSAGYPLRGVLRTAPDLVSAATAVSSIPQAGEAWAEARLLARLGIDTGASLQVGSKELRVTRVLDFAPDRGWQFSDLAPTLLIHIDDIPATGLVQPGSRVTHSRLFAGEPAQVRRWRAALEESLADHERLRDLSDTRPEIRAAVDRAGRFLSLAALVGVLLAAVAVAMSARRYAARQLDTVALMKCMGASQRLIVTHTAVELLLLALFGGLAGSAAGYLAQLGLAAIAADLVGAVLPAASLRVAGLGIAAAVVLLIGFAMPPLLALRKVPPARVLRRDLGPPRPAAVVAYAAAGAASFALLLWMLRDLTLVGWAAIGALATFAILSAGGALLVLLLRRLRGGAGVAWRYGLANIGRRGPESVVQIVAFGTGLMALLLLTVVRNDLMSEWRASLPADAPNHFLINIQPDERAAMREWLREHTGVGVEYSPLVRARLTMIDGVDVGERSYPDRRGRRFALRESNLSWAEELPGANRLERGEWWKNTMTDGVSVERDFAASVGIDLGTKLVFDVAGEEVNATVRSIRSVEWDSFRPNFFMVLQPGLLDDLPATFVAAIYLDPEKRSALLDLVRAFPSVTPIDMNAVFDQVRGVMDKASMAVQYVFLFTLMAGVTVLLAAVQSTRDERLYESAMLRVLGARASVIRTGILAEFAVLGLLAGGLAAVGAGLTAILLSRSVFELDYTPGPMLWLSGLAAGVVLVGGSGWLATRAVASHPPVEILRG